MWQIFMTGLMRSSLFADLTTAWQVLTLIIRITRGSPLLVQRWEVRLLPVAFTQKIPSMRMFPTKILPHPGGPTLPNNGGHWRQRESGGWAVLYGRDLITAASQHRMNGLTLIRILVSWICVVSLKTFI